MDSNKGKAPKRRLSRTVVKVVNEDQYMAAAIGDVEWLKQSLGGYPKRISFDRNGFASIHLASLHGRLDCLRILVEKCEHPVDLASSTGWRPVHLAINNQTGRRALACLKYLVQKGADCSVANEDGVTPCHQAASEGHVQCLKFLIEQGAAINKKDHRDHTPLDLAKLWGHRQCARILTTEIWHKEKSHAAWSIAQVQKRRGLSSSAAVSPTESTSKPKSASHSKKDSVKEIKQMKSVTLPEIALDATQEPKEPSTIRKIFENEQRWNFSGHLTARPYQVCVKDCYPRDVFTKMPAKDATPTHLATQRVIPVSALTHPDDNQKEVLFKCKTVLDIQTKRATFDPCEVLPIKAQAPYHLSSDIRNWQNHDALWLPNTSSHNHSLSNNLEFLTLAS